MAGAASLGLFGLAGAALALSALGLFLILSAVAVALTGITAGLTNYAMAIVLLTASLRFLLTGLFQLSGADVWKTASGVLGLLLTLLAVYAAWAAELEDATGNTVLPTGRHGKGLVVLHGSLFEQVKDVSGEAGVRARL